MQTAQAKVSSWPERFAEESAVNVIIYFDE